MRNLLKQKKIGWPEVDQLSRRDYEMQRWIEKLDSLAVQFDARWGVSALEKLAPFDMAQKWERQKEKINMAIESGNVEIMQQLFDGTKRGYEAMEDAAVALGHKPHGAPVAWTVAMPDGKELAICCTAHDAALVQANCRKDSTLVIWTLQEIANLIAARGDLITAVKNQPQPVLRTREKFDFKKGDEIEF